MTPEIVSLLDTSDRSRAHPVLAAARALVAPHRVAPRAVRAERAELAGGAHDGAEAEAGQGPAQRVAPRVHLDDDGGLLVLDVQLVHEDPGEDEEDPGQDGDQGEDGVGDAALLQQQEEVDDEVET